MSDFKLMWGIVGAGLISNDFCVALDTLDKSHHCLQAVSDRFENVAKEFAERFQIPRYFNSYDDLVLSVDVNIVYVGVINSLHKEVCLKAINAGKHVLCEKPMSCNQEEQRMILEAARAKNVFFMEVIRFLMV
jgi:dihydrodiol dehydrogenase / D-xylose 1-dehydrogenase (NADP)